MGTATETAARLLSTLDDKALAAIGSLLYRLADGPGCEDELRESLAAVDTDTPVFDVAAVAAGIELADMGERGGFLMHITSSAATRCVRRSSPRTNRALPRETSSRADLGLPTRSSILFAVALIGCGASVAEPEPQAEFIAPEEACERDDECVVTDFPGCCACCGCVVPYAIRADALDHQRAECVDRDCTAHQEEEGCAAEECVACPLTDQTFVAVCEGGRCTRH